MLNAWQRRAVSVTLQLTEEAIARIERLLAMPTTGVVRTVADDLAPEERQQISLLCRQVREAVAHAAGQVQAEIAKRSLRQEIRGDVATLWATLEDTKSDGLRGYGALSPEDGALVDDLLETISQPVTAIFRLVETAQERRARHRPVIEIGQAGRG